MNNLENVEVSDIPFIIVEANGVILKANDAAGQFFNYSQEEIKGLLSNLLIADLEIINRQISPSSAEGVSIKKGFAIKRYGDKLPIEYKYYKVFDQNQKVQFALKITDYTNSCYEKEINLNAQKANNKDQFNFSSIFTENPAAGWVIDQKSFQIVDVNETALRQYGYTKTEFLEKTLLDILPPDEVIRLKNKLKNQDNLASVYTGRWKNRLKMGEIIHVEIQKNFLDDSDFILILATDITSYVRKEEFEAVIKLNNNPLINSTKDQIWSVSVDYKLMEANKSFLKLLEFSTGIQFKPGDNFLEHPFTKTFVEQWDIYFQKALKGQRVREEVSIPKTSNLPATLVELSINSIFKEEEIVGTVFYVRNIPETKKAEQKIIESEKALAEAQRLARLGNWSQNLETGELKWSDQLYEIFGIQQEELLRSNRSFFHIVNKPNMQELLTAMKHARKTGESYSVIYEITTPNHERRIIEEKGYGKKDEQGKVIEIFGTAQDITAKMLVEEALRLSNENYNLISKATNDAIWEWDIQTGQITKSGDGFKILFGYENDFGIEKHHANHHLIHPEDFKDVLESQKIVFENPAENYWEKVFRFRKADGKYAYIHNRGYIVRDNSGKPIRMIAATQDVTVYKEQLNEIKNLQQNLQITINATDDLIWSIDKDLKIKTANKAFLEFTSYIFPEGNIQDIDFNSLNLEIKEKEKWEKIYARALTGEKFSFTDDVLNNQTKEWRHFVTTFSPIIDKNENISGVVCFAKDITELKNSALELQHSEKRFKDLFQLSPQPKWLFEKDTYKIVEVNKAAIDHYGYTEKEFLNMTLHDLGSKNNPDVTQQNINDKIKNKAEHNKVYKHRKKNGEIIYVRIYSTTLEFDEHSYLLITAIDITERRKQEHNINKAIIKAQENERFEIGSELHDNICQLLVSSKMRTSILKEHIPKEKMTIFEESQDYIVTALDEIRNLSHQLAPSFFSEITMEESIHKLFDSVNFSGKYRIHLDFCPQINEQDMSLDMKLNLYRILQEQFKNILKYANATVVHVDIHQHENLLTMSIADNGVGFDSKTVKSGIGISNMKRRAELCSGEFFLKTAPGKGTEITIILPIDNTMDS